MSPETLCFWMQKMPVKRLLHSLRYSLDYTRYQPGPSAGVWPEASCGVFLCGPSLSQGHTPAIATSGMQVRVFTSEFSQRVCRSEIFLVCNLV